MALTNMAAGGNFKLPSASQGYNHNHASVMAHAAHRKASVAKALMAVKGPPAPPASVVPAPPMAAPTVAHIAHHATTQGVHPTVQHVHAAIDRLMTKGRFTPVQATALKHGNGAPQGPPGLAAMNDISNELKVPM